MTLEQYKDLFFKSKKLHLNNGGLSPIMKPAHDEINYWAKRFYEDGFYSDHDYMEKVDWTRQQVAQLIDCEKDEVAFFQSSAWGISQFAFGIQLQKEDEVLLFDQEYSSNLYPWQQACKKAGAQLVLIDSDISNNQSICVEKIVEKITSHTKVIAVSWVQFQTGAMIDLQKLSEVCQSKKIYLFVDAMQALGIHKLSFKNLKIDALVCGSHKWLNAAVGVAFLAIKKELAIKMNPIALGSSTYGSCDDASDLLCAPKLNAFKFEAGSKQVLEICALGKSIEVINQIKPDILKNEAFRLAQLLNKKLKELNLTIHSDLINPSQFVNFSCPNKDNKNVQKYLHQQGVDIPVRGPGLRVTPHAFNTDDDIERFIQILKPFVS